MAIEKSAAPSPRVLIVDDDPELLSALSRLLGMHGYQVTAAGSAEAALEQCRSQTFHLVLTDMQLPGLSGIALIHDLRQSCPATRCVLLTGHGSIRSAVVALKRGAVEYITKPIQPKRLLSLCGSLTAEAPAYLPNRLLFGEHADVARESGMVARSVVMRRVFERIVLAGATSTPVLVTGEMGAGKEHVARAIHARSARSAGPFIAVHTGNLPPDLMAIDLVGSDRRVAAAGGDRLRGKLDLAEGGTLYVDEVGALDEASQLALFGILNSGTFTRVGGEQDLPANVRIIAGSSRDLRAGVQSCTFREDLYFRLTSFAIHIPALRERREDISVIAADLASELAGKYGKPASAIPAETDRLLQAYDWPGNVRELHNVVEQAVLLARGGEIDPALLPQMLHKEPPAEVLQITIGASMEAIEREVILRTLEAHKGNKTAAAEALGISRRSIYNKLAEYAGPDGTESQ